MKDIKRHFAVTFASQIITTLQGIVVMPLVIRTAGITVYGASVVWPNALASIFVCTYFGVGYSYRRKLASADGVAERRTLFEPQYTYQLTFLALICVLASAAALLFGTRFSEGEISVSIWVPILWLAVHFLFFQTQEYFRNTLRFDYFNLINILSNVLFVASVVAWSFSGHPMTLTTLLLLTAATKAVATLPWTAMLVGEIGVPRLRLPWRTIIADAKVGWPLFLDYFSITLLAFGDRYLITIFLSIADAGRYQPGYQLATLLMFIPRCGDMLLTPILGRLVDSGEQAGAQRLSSDFLHFFLMIAIPFAVGAALAGPSIVALLANNQTAEASRWVTCLVVVGTALYGVSVLYYQGAYVLGRMRLVMIANLIGVSLNIALNTVLLYLFRNLTVAALASLLSYGATTLYVVLALRQDWSFQLDWGRIGKFVLAMLVMAGALLLAGLRPLSVSTLSLWSLVGVIGLGAALYFAVLALIGGLGLQAIARIAANRSTVALSTEIREETIA